jgi:hypothetical protein
LDNRIIQIMPAAEGWRALYAGRDEAGAPITVVEPLVGWALQEEKIYPNDEKAYRSVVGLDGGDSVVEPCPEAANFVRYLRPGDNPDSFLDEVEEHLRRKNE